MSGSYRFCVVAVLILAGCGRGGPTLYPVQGTLKKGDQPLAGVTVNFLPVETNQPGSAGVVGSDGRFTMYCQNGRPGAVAGLHKVVLGAPKVATTPEAVESRYRDTPPPPPGYRPSTGLGTGGPGPQEDLPFPKEYASPETTPRQFEVIPGADNTIEILLE